MNADSRPAKEEGILDQCPNCSSFEIHREEVDIGVGTMKGPRSCEGCGWQDVVGLAEFLGDDDDWITDRDMEDQ